jgi:hypothetical protein
MSDALPDHLHGRRCGTGSRYAPCRRGLSHRPGGFNQLSARPRHMAITFESNSIQAAGTAQVDRGIYRPSQFRHARREYRPNGESCGTSRAKLTMNTPWSCGTLHEAGGRRADVTAGQAVIVSAGQWVQYSTPRQKGPVHFGLHHAFARSWFTGTRIGRAERFQNRRGPSQFFEVRGEGHRGSRVTHGRDCPLVRGGFETACRAQ